MKNKLMLPIIILVISLILSGYVHITKTKEYETWVSTTGVIDNIEIRERRKTSDESHSIYYSYNVNGVEYSGENTYSTKNTDFEIGQVVDIWYDIDSPQNSSFHKPRASLNSLVPLLVGVLLSIATLKKSRRS